MQGRSLLSGSGRLPIGPTLAAVFLYAMIVVTIGIVLGSTTEPAADGDAVTAPPPFISDIAQRRRVYEVLADTGLLAIAYYAAFRLRFQGADFDVFFPPFVRSLPDRDRPAGGRPVLRPGSIARSGEACRPPSSAR